MKKIFIVISLLLITSCATYPPPKVENGIYTNPELQFSLRVPHGWMYTENIPIDQFVMFQPTFISNFTYGFFLITGEISKLDLRYIPPSDLKKNLSIELEKQKKEELKHKLMKSIDFEIYETNVGEIPNLFASVDKIIEDSDSILHVNIKSYIYTCHENFTCIVDLGVVSDPRSLNDNLRALERFVKSLRKVPAK